MKFLIEKLLFKDISSGNDPAVNRKVNRLKWIALCLMVFVLLTGAVLAAAHAYSYYNTVKEAFFAEPETIMDLGVLEPRAVWFTQESGDPYNIQGILAYLNQYENNRLVLDVVNVNDIPLTLVSIQDADGYFSYPFSDNTLLEPTTNYQPQTYTFNDVNEALLVKRSEIIINYRYDDGILRQAYLIPFKRMNEEIFDNTSIRTTDNTDAFDFFQQDEKYIRFTGSQVAIDQPLYIPAGKILKISAGQQIDLINGAFIVSRTAISIAGTTSQPVRFLTSDGSGRGLLVMQAEQESNITHAIFDGLDTPKSGFWELTGAVTFYESNVAIQKSEFINNISEDGLNIIRSQFSISDTHFQNTASDAFDADFCEGIIRDSIFEDTINDAIDASGSMIEIHDTLTKNNGDKGISVGENSHVTLNNITIDQAVVGIASKDLSEVTGKDIRISNSRIALTLYIKKTEFGPAEMQLENLVLDGDIDLDYLIQPGSTLTIEGQSIQPRAAAKETLLFEKMINGEPIQ